MDSMIYMAFEQLLLGMFPAWLLLIFAILVVWEVVWKGIALWHAGRNRQLAWFVCILIFNTVGILPIIYLAFFQKKKR
jgi:hypothetical protein